VCVAGPRKARANQPVAAATLCVALAAQPHAPTPTRAYTHLRTPPPHTHTHTDCGHHWSRMPVGGCAGGHAGGRHERGAVRGWGPPAVVVARAGATCCVNRGGVLLARACHGCFSVRPHTPCHSRRDTRLFSHTHTHCVFLTLVLSHMSRFDLTWGPIEYHRRSLDNLQVCVTVVIV
jgi:hypothetical protein